MRMKVVRNGKVETVTLTHDQAVELQLQRIVALGVAVRESAWEAAQAQLAALRFAKHQSVNS